MSGGDEGAAMQVARAKINLFLHVGARDDAGYHALESLVAFTEAGDVLRFAPADALSLTITGPFGTGLSAGGDNLVLRAARALHPTRGAAIALEKYLPVASGIGGGSADAAAALRGLNQMWGLGRTPDELRALGASLGSDIPVCVASAPAWMEGRGERVTLLPRFPSPAIVLANPRVAVPTGPVFAALAERRGVQGLRPDGDIDDIGDLLRFLEGTGNDLQPPAIGIAPAIGDVLRVLAAQPGALMTRMAGSGATCFAIFAAGHAAQAAAHAIRTAHPGWWVKASRLEGTRPGGGP